MSITVQSYSKRKPDRRIERTRTLLGDALIALTVEQGYDSITVQNITDKANLSRATFYLHYRDKDELLTDRLAKIYAEIAESMNLTLTLDDMRWNGKSPTITTFEHTLEHRDLYRALCHAQSTNLVMERIVDVLAGLIKGMLLMNYGEQPDLPVPLDMICQNMAAALHAITRWWITTDAPFTADEMAEMFHAINVPPLLAMLKRNKK